MHRHMKVVLLQNIEGLGKRHDIVDVKLGYGRNYLLPRGLATFLTPPLKKSLAAERAREDAKHEALRAKREEVLAKLASTKLQFKRKVSGTGKLFGGISRTMIAKAIKEQAGYDLPTSVVRLADPIKKVGTTHVKIHLAEDAEVSVPVTVAAEK